MVAQKPAGNFNPLSSFGHPWLLASAPELDCFLAGAKELATHIAASATRAGNRVLNALDNCMEHSRRSTARNHGLTRGNTPKIYHTYCNAPRSRTAPDKSISQELAILDDSTARTEYVRTIGARRGRLPRCTGTALSLSQSRGRQVGRQGLQNLIGGSTPSRGSKFCG